MTMEEATSKEQKQWQVMTAENITRQAHINHTTKKYQIIKWVCQTGKKIQKTKTQEWGTKWRQKKTLRLSWISTLTEQLSDLMQQLSMMHGAESTRTKRQHRNRTKMNKQLEQQEQYMKLQPLMTQTSTSSHRTRKTNFQRRENQIWKYP